jgi:tetratricopeptide (TPR) repeat protein
MSAGRQRKKKRRRPPQPAAVKKSPSPSVGRPPTGPRLWLFRILAVTVVPAAFLVLLEIALRISGYGFDAAAIVKDRIAGEVVYRDNPRFGWLFFPWQIAREPSPYRFTADKAKDTYRIFVLGSSAAQGTPDPAFAFSRILEVMLTDHYPDMRFEVINTAMVATNSHVVRRIARECARHEPDLFIVYCGNNEVVGPFGAGTVFSPLAGNIHLIRTAVALKATRTGQLLADLAGRLGGTSDMPAVWTGMEMFLEKQIRADDDNLQTVYSHFRSNLEGIRKTAVSAGAKVIFSNVATNLRDNPPFASLHRPDLSGEALAQWQSLYDAGVRLEQQKQFKKAIDKYAAAAAIDNDYADLHFRLAKCYDQLKDPSNALEHYVRARDLDTLRFRADTRINEIIRSVAQHDEENGVEFVDAVAALAAEGPNGIIGNELFHEHVHLNFTGNYLIARQLFDRISTLLGARARRRVVESPLHTEQQCRDALVYTIRDEYANAAEVLNDFLKRPPFTHQLYHADRIARREKEVDDLRRRLTPETLAHIDAQYQQAIAAGRADWWMRWKYAEFLSEQMRNERAASIQYGYVRDYLPHYAQIWAKLGTSLGKQGNLAAAVEMNRHAIRLSPAHVFAHHNLAFAYQMLGRDDKALEHYRLALRYKPDYAESWNNIGAILYTQGHVDEAVATFRKAQNLVRDYADLYYNLGVIFEEKGRIAEAIEQYRAALNVEPDSPKLQKALKIALAKQK